MTWRLSPVVARSGRAIGVNTMALKDGPVEPGHDEREAIPHSFRRLTEDTGTPPFVRRTLTTKKDATWTRMN
jgi:hypothetical protein